MEILSALLRVEVEITGTILRDMTQKMAAVPRVELTRGQKGSIKRFLKGKHRA